MHNSSFTYSGTGLKGTVAKTVSSMVSKGVEMVLKIKYGCFW